MVIHNIIYQVLNFIVFNLIASSIGEYKLPIERGMISVNDEEELLHLEPILRLMKPKSIPLPPPLPSLKRSSSLGRHGIVMTYTCTHYTREHIVHFMYMICMHVCACT